MIDVTQIVHPKIALLTKHGKQDIIAPIMRAAFNSEIVHTQQFDTDTLGSFDHAIARTLSPAECALKKAYLACELTNCEQGIGSEGSFNSLFGMGVIDEECLAFVDVKRNIAFVASAKEAVRLGPIEASDIDNLQEQLNMFSSAQSGLVNNNQQKWMLKHSEGWHKGLSSTELLKTVVEWPVYLEPDFRAMHCPARQAVIASAAHNLVIRLQALCPQCSAVNYVPKHVPKHVPKRAPNHVPNHAQKHVAEHAKESAEMHVAGHRAEAFQYLPCELCGQQTTKIVPPHPYCDSCGFAEQHQSEETSASAFYCHYCNP